MTQNLAGIAGDPQNVREFRSRFGFRPSLQRNVSQSSRATYKGAGMSSSSFLKQLRKSAEKRQQKSHSYYSC